ncbi:ParE-like toxin of type II ParDE toxin-antitoxin system [Nonlabens dokdonensis]|jgi:plasmid stabilization system protein ParE|uniref:Plasmid stabilization system n=2 Tax=Nonlabens dokdonensis TaxID=328515 RepID=L7WD31_NONDD|nr:type II toxin-antitoxin system RelE/ParE family toxin [Nonlabens dokdonensis]AGC77821.1 plasmid stabilization system [Nonlabens dokdonensis DSW-6]PZX39647.1 ParE-like toxin of type II ParDE toxin-antitoxin system [Nonlabens dokdonensis]
MYSLEIKEEARLQITDVFHYYESKRLGLGDLFLNHLENYFKRIIENPEHFPEKRKPYREAYLKRFPFLVIYTIEETKIIIYAVFNTSRNPDKK